MHTRAMHARIFIPLLLILLPELSCSNDLSIPQGALVHCADGEHCPGDTVCSERIGRCVRTATGDREPPRILHSTLRLEPKVARIGQQVLLSFEVSTRLAFPPVVELELPTRPWPGLEMLAQSAESYSFGYEVTGSEPQGEVDLSATLVDTWGTLAVDQKLGRLTLDFRPPQLEGFELRSGPLLTRGATAEVEIELSEPLMEAPGVFLWSPRAELGTIMHVVQQQGPAELLCRCTIDPELGEGPTELRIFAEDLAGNTSLLLLREAFTLDFQAPAIRRGPIVLNPVLRTGETLELLFDASEAFGQSPEAWLETEDGSMRRPLYPQERAGWDHSFTRTIGEREEGRYNILLSRLVDLAGNRQDEQWSSPEPVVVDCTPPWITKGPRLNKVVPFYREGEFIQLRFSVSEELGEDLPPRAWLATDPRLPLPCSPTSGASGPGPGPEQEPVPMQQPEQQREPEYICRTELPLEQGDGPQGRLGITLELEDEAGNQGVDVIYVTLDFEAPKLAADPILERCDRLPRAREAPDELWIAQDLRCPDRDPALGVSFGLNEWTSPEKLPVVRIAERHFLLLEGRAGSSFFVYGYDPDGGEPQSDSADPDPRGQRAVAEVWDRAGNRAEITLGTLFFDFVAPRGIEEQEQERDLVALLRDPLEDGAAGGRVRTRLLACPAPWEAHGLDELADAFWQGCPEPEEGSSPFEPRSLITVYSTRWDADEQGWQCESSALAMGRLDEQDGHLALSIPGDWPAVCVTETDPAGNESDPTLVQSRD